jgi:hypothetical protein
LGENCAAPSVRSIVNPATVSTPVRELVAVLGAAKKDAVPLPLPLLPEVIVSHEALLAAVH